MDLTLGLGESPARHVEEFSGCGGDRLSVGMKLGFCMGLELELERKIQVDEENRVRGEDLQKVEERRWSVDPPLQLNLLPRLDSTQLTLSWPAENKVKSLNFPSVDEAEERVAISSSPVRTDSILPMNVAGGFGVAAKRAFSRGSDEDENDRGRKKLRLSKEQSAFLEESFKKQNTLNPKLKFALAKQLNLRPRQIEVWFQNRRARTKLKLMEMDCEFLKRRCETLREENRRLHKEVAELRAMKTFSFQMPPTKLSICRSCERLSPPTSPPQPLPTPR